MIDWDDAFDNTGYIPGAEQQPAIWAKAAAAFRDSWRSRGLLEENIRYGPDARMVFDLFQTEGDGAGLMVFVHGGYWRRFDKSYWSHLAQGALERGWNVAMPSYPLAPHVRMAAITQAICAATEGAAARVPGPLRLAGHSAGGHLVTRMMCEGVLNQQTAARLEKVVSISGLHALEPLVSIAINDDLRLTVEEAQSESPANLPPLPKVPLVAWVGAQERPEFIRQTRLIEEVWASASAQVSAVYDPGHHHFSVIDALVDAHSPLTNAILG